MVIMLQHPRVGNYIFARQSSTVHQEIHIALPEKTSPRCKRKTPCHKVMLSVAIGEGPILQGPVKVVALHWQTISFIWFAFIWST